MKRIDLNADVGEGFPHDGALLKIVTSANIGCGAHAGSEDLSLATVVMARELGVTVGLHVGYPDRPNFGRVTMDVDVPSVLRALHRQVRLFPADYIKPHGAFYHDSSTPGSAADLLADLVAETELPLLGLAGTEHERIARLQHVRFLREGFIDRRQDAHGRLIPRSEPGAVIESFDEAVANALQLAEVCDSLCVHGDTAFAVEFATGVRSALEQRGYQICSWL